MVLLTETVTLLPPEEMADTSIDLDKIIDTMWWIVSLSFGACYWSAPNPNFWAARYKRLFYTDLKTRWLHAGTSTDFGVIFGDFPFENYIMNLRTCVSAMYVTQGLADRQLVRTLNLADPKMAIEAGLKRKIGKVSQIF